ncbi:tyrosine aminotransferase [Neoconidiobolus thromboides FSU 785]|nr:tyrosine aminotransferase [Neoconidiobolus thromboides FSU 785]
MTTPANNSWDIKITEVAKRTYNPIRQVVDGMKVAPNPEKKVISLSIGDPTVFGNFKVHDSIEDSLIKAIKSSKANGYAPAHGFEYARQAIADKFSTETSPLTANDVIIGSGCSGALELVVSAMINHDQTLLIPRPGFSLYRTFAESKGFNVEEYDLLPEKQWEIDLEQLDKLITNKTGAVLINNPSNPCGSVFSKEHLIEILKVCEKHRVPIIADEIYCDMVFEGNQFYPIASLTSEVPVIAVGGIAKKYLVPGWRVGWAMVHDRNGLLEEVRKALISLSQLIIGSNTLIQAALPDILHNTPEEFYQDTIKALEHNVKISHEILSNIPGLHVIEPQGAMYMMVGIDTTKLNGISDDVQFTEKLMAEESVFCLPGKCFRYPNYFRVVITAPPEQLKEAYLRIEQFCKRYTK